MAITPYENLKGFAHSKPPLIVFMACLGFFAVILMSLAYYVKLTEHIYDPDVRQDWNVFLKRFSTVEFCMQHNVSEIASGTSKSSHVATTTAPQLSLDERDVKLDTYDMTRNYSLFMQLSVIPTPDFVRIPHNVTHVTGTITGDMIGLMGQQATEEINITMELPYEWNNTKCHQKSCEKINFFACVVFHASVNVFPRTESPGTCESVANETGVEYYTTMLPQKTSSKYPSYFCNGRSMIHMRPDVDRTFTVYLSVDDRSVINLHLMHTSYFLFVMVVTILCYAVLRGRPQKSKITQTEALLGPSYSDA